MSVNAPKWLTEAPIAHRGLHDPATGIVENTLAAAGAAIARAISIECDVQISQDGEAIVFHDATLDRLTLASGRLGALSVRELAEIDFKGCSGRIPTLSDLLDRIDGKVPLICEIKSRFDGDMRLAHRVSQLATGYGGPLAIKSFDPAIIAHLRASPTPPGPRDNPCPLGMVAEARYKGQHWRALTPQQRSVCTNFLHLAETRPDFLSWNVDDLPHPTPFLLGRLASLPVLAWTVRTQAQKQVAREWADQVIFEGDLAG
jgi:glycerophosphoryl diester phosphodiesterase